MKNIENEPRAFRGGSGRCSSIYCRAAFPNRNEPGLRCDFLGFRVALSSPQDRVSLPSSVLPSNRLSPGSP